MPPLTILDIAREAGVSATTVSAALRGRRGVSPANAARIRAIADRLGYVADAAAASMGQRRQQSRSDAFGKLTVAFLSQNKNTYAYFEAAAKSLGMASEFVSTQGKASPLQTARELWARGVQGLCLALGPEDPLWVDSLVSDLVWQRFSMVKQSRGEPRLPLHLVRHNAFDYTHLALRELTKRGFRRIAVLLFPSGSEIDDDSRVGAILNYKLRHLPPAVTLAWRFCNDTQAYPLRPEHLAWLRKQKPDAVLSLYWVVLYSLLEAGHRIPGDFGFATLLGVPHTDPKLPPISGCDIRAKDRALRAATLLRDMIYRRETGFPEHPTELVIEPLWLQGETLGQSIG